MIQYKDKTFAYLSLGGQKNQIRHKFLLMCSKMFSKLRFEKKVMTSYSILSQKTPLLRYRMYHIVHLKMIHLSCFHNGFSFFHFNGLDENSF